MYILSQALVWYIRYPDNLQAQEKQVLFWLLSEKGREKFLRILAKLFKIGGLNQILFENMVYIWKIGNIEDGGGEDWCWIYKNDEILGEILFLENGEIKNIFLAA